MNIEEKLKRLNEIQAICSICRKELREEEVCKVTDGQSVIVDLCYGCYGRVNLQEA